MLVVKYLGPTNHNGSRWKATGFQGSATIPQDYSADFQDNALNAARAYARRFNTDGEPEIVGQLPCGSDAGAYVVVFEEGAHNG